MAKCQHLSFEAKITVNRLEDTGAYVAEISIICRECEWPFIFPMIPPGLSSQHLTVSIDGQELNVPIQPKGSDIFPAFPGFGVKAM